jgi:hypothetical protein
MDNLVHRLAIGKHPVIASRVISTKDLITSIDRGYVVIKFTDTQGGTELVMRLDDTLTITDDVDYSNSTGIVHLVGSLTLDFVRVRCIADVDISTLTGQGHIELQD